MVSPFTAMVSFLSETIWNQMKPYHFYQLLPNQNCLCGSSLFLPGYETNERSSLGRSGAPLPAADAGGPLRWRNKEHCEAAASKATIFLKGKQGAALWEEPGGQEVQASPTINKYHRKGYRGAPETAMASVFFMSIFKVEFKRYHFPKSTFGEDLN